MPNRRSMCPVACTLDILGDKWTLLVVRDLLLGRTQFKDFVASPEHIATNILTDRLNRLVEHQLVERYPAPQQPGRDAYRLTPKGKALGPVIKSIVKWGTDHFEDTQVMLKAKK